MTAPHITNVRPSMRGAPGLGVWFEGVADLRAEHRPGDPDGWCALLDTIRCGCRHDDSQAATRCARKAAQTRLARGATRTVLTTRP
jgi:hypothetical protein